MKRCELFTNKQALKDYVKWRDDPRTQDYLGIVVAAAVPRMPEAELLVHPGISAALHAQQCGAHWAVSLLQNLDQGPQVGIQDELEATYGKKQILEEARTGGSDNA